jgi:hemerythrin-like metal-binding protein
MKEKERFMGRILWDDSYSVGIKQFDDAHKQLILMINNLHEGIEGKKGIAVTGNVLGGMIEYALNHFSHEEEFMRVHAYPDLDSHRDLHDDFFVKVNELRERFKIDGETSADELMNYLNEWLIHHIMNIDKKYSAFFKNQGI